MQPGAQLAAGSGIEDLDRVAGHLQAAGAEQRLQDDVGPRLKQRRGRFEFGGSDGTATMTGAVIDMLSNS